MFSRGDDKKGFPFALFFLFFVDKLISTTDDDDVQCMTLRKKIAFALSEFKLSISVSIIYILGTSAAGSVNGMPDGWMAAAHLKTCCLEKGNFLHSFQSSQGSQVGSRHPKSQGQTDGDFFFYSCLLAKTSPSYLDRWIDRSTVCF